MSNLIIPFRGNLLGASDEGFKITVDTTKVGSASNTFVLPLQNGATSMTVFWGDGNSDVITAYNQAELTHVYSSSGSYQVTLDGIFYGIKFNNGGDKLKLSSIDSWGTNQWGSMNRAFFGCSNMIGTYSDAPDTSSVLLMDYAFNGCTNFNSSLNIDTSSVTTMTRMFWLSTNFNQPLNWDTSSVSDFSYMMYNCAAFNQAINFNTSSGTNMQWMFKGCSTLNSSFSLSDTSLVGNMSQMFSGCTLFNQAINFDMTSVTIANTMFYNCQNFNQAITFNAPLLSLANSMFERCYVLNQPVSLTTSSSLTNTSRMFALCYLFNSPLSISNTSGVTSMQSMFSIASAFDQDISAFQINALTNAVSMLQASSFSQTNYDLLLPAWDAYGTSGVTFHAGTAQYAAFPSAPATARALMVGRGWTITDGGPI